MCWRIGAGAAAAPGTATDAGKSKCSLTKRLSAAGVSGFSAR